MNDRASEIAELMEAAEAAVSGEAVIPEDPAPHSILEVWSSILSNIESESKVPVSIKQAAKITGTWPKIAIWECDRFHVMYYEYLTEMRDILDAEIASDPQCFSRTGEADAEDNWHHYMNLNLLWITATREWEKEWRCAEPESHIRMAALVEAGSFVIGPQSIMALLEQIGFRIDVEDAETMTEILREGEQ